MASLGVVCTILFSLLALSLSDQGLGAINIINQKDSTGQTALIAAAIGGHAHCVEILCASAFRVARVRRAGVFQTSDILA